MQKNGENRATGVRLRKPSASDGARVWDLVAACPPLDKNSMYCNLLQCTDFSDTCILAERGTEILGWISGYRPPREPGTLFIWQVAVHARARGLGLAGKMLGELLARDTCEDVSFLKTNITPDNDASLALFRSLADRAGARLTEGPGFSASRHFDDRHASERLIAIGPFRSAAKARSAA